MTTPGVLAVRAANQYRRRDVLAYLGLRYYLANSAARSDRWAQEVATDLVLRRGEPTYLTVQHFKEVDSLGRISHREMFLPGPNEALAEAALLDACARAGGAFVPADSVFSYRLATAGDTSGVYQHYMHGLRQRHAAIADACRRTPDAEVLFLDIRRFYPSVTTPRAKAAWISASEAQGMGSKWVELGVRLTDDHGRASGTRDGHLLTGPMFSHLVGNLLLRNVDRTMGALSARYFRYVDDITLVGSRTEIDRSVSALRKELDPLGLTLHDQGSSKWIAVSAQTWLQGEHDYSERKRSPSWMTLIGDLKRLLVTRPELRAPLIDQLAENGFRLPVPDYSAAIAERGYRDRFAELLKSRWFERIVLRPSVETVISQAKSLRKEYFDEAVDLLQMVESTDAFNAKRILPKLRYRFGRLAYLGEPTQLEALAAAAARIPALRFQSTVAKAIATGNLNEIIEYGVNAAQAVAQPLRMQAKATVIGIARIDRSYQQAMAVLKMNGLKLDLHIPRAETSELLTFAGNGVDSSMMRSSDSFMRELACLHGISEHPRHEQTLSTALDRAEEIALDAIEQEHRSS